MLFTQIEFIYFFAFVLCGVAILRNIEARNIFLLLASYYFYAYWDWRFLGLIIFCTLTNYFSALAMGCSNSKGKRKTFVLLAVVVSLSCLGFFKYYNFFIESIFALTSISWLEKLLIKIVLPIGISFFTFQAMSYSIDVYRGHIKPCSSIINFSLYVAFFPQLVAGPIVRATDLLPQIERPNPITFHRLSKGMHQFAFGLFKKVVIADRLSFFVDYCFENYAILDSSTIWVATIAFSLQIYCDFSGYSDMAIGVARMLGYDFKANFDHPYLSRNITEFWRRWHISLSTWLRDYIYIPLGGSRKGQRRMYFNLMGTMLLAGLWHGASWNFVIWGGLHGSALIVHRFLRASGLKTSTMSQKIWPIAATFAFVNFAWVFFRVENFSEAINIIQRMFIFQSGIVWYHPGIIVCILIMASYYSVRNFFPETIGKVFAHPVLAPTILFTLIFTSICFYPTKFQPFIYFQF